MARKTPSATQDTDSTESDFLKKEFQGLSLKQRAALKGWLASNGSVPEAVKAAGVDRSTWYHWKKNDPDFLRALELLDEMDADDLEHQANTFARAGDTTLLIFLLKAKRRAKYDDAYARQERALEKGLQPAEHFVPVRALLVRDAEPPGVKAPAPPEPPAEQEH
jgi:hypothetical protein